MIHNTNILHFVNKSLLLSTINSPLDADHAASAELARVMEKCVHARIMDRMRTGKIFGTYRTGMEQYEYRQGLWNMCVQERIMEHLVDDTNKISDLKGRVLVRTRKRVGKTMKPWMMRPIMTVPKYQPSLRNSSAISCSSKDSCGGRRIKININR